ncbi:MAG: hypothetical protein HEQ35_01775 [Gloeotrichia echinulata IR180]|jgi:hypothetical protein|nr:hypothetical protein [Gloeotrichia echinulata DEX184]
MFATNKATNSTNIQVESATPVLVEELSDGRSEQVSGGRILTPEIPGTTVGDSNSIPSGGGYSPTPMMGGSGGIDLNPFYLPQHASKLPRLGPIDPSTRTSPKNVMTITIPLPEM